MVGSSSKRTEPETTKLNRNSEVSKRGSPYQTKEKRCSEAIGGTWGAERWAGERGGAEKSGKARPVW